jgi:hypothetical protein
MRVGEMDDSLFKVLYEGDVLPGKTQYDVQAAIAKLFGVEPKQVDRLFTGKQRKLKSGLTLDQAKKYVKALAKLGALAFIMPHEEGDNMLEQAQNIEEQFTNSGSFNANTFKAHFERLEAKKNQPEADHTILDLDQMDSGEAGKTETQEDEISGKEMAERPVESSTIEEKTEQNENMTTEELDEHSSIQNVVSSEVLRKMIAEHKHKQ